VLILPMPVLPWPSQCTLAVFSLITSRLLEWNYQMASTGPYLPAVIANAS
jgi:hypothetical protein